MRERLVAECEADDRCAYVYPHGHRFFRTKHCGLGALGANATFCFEPGGDSPYRKGLYDAMLTGCIPVVFSAYNENIAPWFVPKGVVVRLSETEYVNGSFSALDRLRAMPADEIARRQRVLARGARRLQYATADVPGDAYETLLAGALGLSRDLGRVYGAL